ncbi:MAG: flagellar basal-body rod protein FlgF [Massilia sp.]
MSEVLALALNSLQDDMRRVEHVAMNLANSLTPGYKRQVAVSQPFAGLVDSASAAAAAAGKRAGSPQTFVDVHAGALKKTGESLDLALGGDGFFEIQTPEGPAYTRQGNFRTDERGRLVTAQGQPVMGAGGEITLSSATPRIAPDGTVYDTASGAGQAQLGRIRVVRFDDTKDMTSLGSGLLTAGSGMTDPQASQAQVQQGYLENSNVSSQHEMVQLMQATRHFESVEKAIQGYDELMDTAIRKLGEA